MARVPIDFTRNRTYCEYRVSENFKSRKEKKTGYTTIETALPHRNAKYLIYTWVNEA